MRLIFFSLCIVNIVIAVWGLFLRADDSFAAGEAGVAKTAELRAAGSEQFDGGQLDQAVHLTSDSPEPFEEAPEVQLPSVLPGESKGLCELVGPFESRSNAENFSERLLSIDVKSTVENIELPAGQSYWVHLKPELNSDAAFRRLSELQSQGIESYVIRKGELQNAISLGVFTYKDLATRRLTSLKKMGLAPQITVVERTQIEVWVMLQPVEVQKMSEITWTRMLQGLRSQERRQNFCLDVAS